MTATKKNNFEIKRAELMGFCSGVRRAIKIIENAAAENGSVVSLGAVVHNQDVVDKLKEKGVHLIKELDKIDGDYVAITSHGVGPDTIEELKKRGKQIVDTTCTNVQNAQHIARELAENGFQVIIFGEADHPEVKGLMNWAGNKALVTMNSRDIKKIDRPRQIGIISQTTQSLDKYENFIREIFALALPDIKELRIYNTLCRETIKRQDSAMELAKNSDVVLVIGGSNSANTKRLADICSELTETHFIERADEISTEWLKNKKVVGITAGASTPDETIQQVIHRLESLNNIPD
jgi:4-hydroxy-3-methylbut-2-enyl diphosphate reductase